MIVIRPAEERDLPDITSIYAEAVVNSTATWEEEPPSLAEISSTFAARNAAGLPYFVAENEGGKVVGYACGSSFHPQSGWRYSIEDSIYVAGDARRQGVGRRLLKALIDEATARGFRHMIAGISIPGGESSVAFHEALGFRKVGEIANAGWKHGKWLTAVYFQRALGEGANTPPE